MTTASHTRRDNGRVNEWGRGWRQATEVEWLRLGTLEDLVTARRRTEAYGLSTHIAAGRVLIIWRDPDVLVSASLGQWLTYTPATGAFEVHDDDEFRTAHNAVTGADSE